MLAYLMHYTCQVRCYDGIVRRFEHSGYFVTIEAFHACLNSWDGCRGPLGSDEPYSYFVTGKQLQRNASRVLVPNGERVLFGPYEYHRKVIL